MKYESAINEILSLFHSPWMDAQDKEEMNREVLKAMGKTMEELDDEIEKGVIRGYSVETQVELARKLVSIMENHIGGARP